MSWGTPTLLYSADPFQQTVGVISALCTLHSNTAESRNQKTRLDLVKALNLWQQRFYTRKYVKVRCYFSRSLVEW